MSKSSRRPPEEDKPARRSWRGSGNGSAKAEGARFGWRQGRAPVNYHARKWLIGIPMIVGVLGLFVATAVWILWQPKPTPLVCLFITDYEAPLAPQAFVQEDVEYLQTLFRSDQGGAGGAGSISVGKDPKAKPSKATTADEFIAELREAMRNFPPDSFRKKPQLVYLSAQGVVDAAGQPCLVLAAGQQPDESGLATAGLISPSQALPASRLVSVEKVIETVATVHNNTKHRIVLLLDCVRWERNWRLGMASNPFAQKLKEILKDEWNHVAILHATSDDETSAGEVGLVDLRQGHTLFGKFVARGLAGEADGSNAKKEMDEQITLDELHAYLTDRIGAAAAGRGRRQRPLLVKGKNAPDFVLAKTDASAVAAVDAYFIAQTFEPVGDWLSKISAGWKALDDQRRQQGDDSAPAESLLSEEAQRQHWQEQLAYCLAGKAYIDQQRDLTVAGAPPLATLPAVSLPLAFQTLTPTSAQIQQGQAALQAALAPPPADPAAAPPAAQPPAVPPTAQPPAAQPPTVYREIAWAAWQAALGGREFSATEQAILEQVRSQSNVPALVELGALARFHPGNPHLPESMRDAKAALLDLLSCRDGAERASFLAGDARVLPVLRTRLVAGDTLRRQAEDRLFGGQVDIQSIAAVKLEFSNLEQQSGEIAAALALRDRVWADLPYLLEWAVATGDKASAADLLAALGNLEQALAAGATQPADWRKLRKALADPRQALLEDYRSQWGATVSDTAPGAHVSQFQSMERLLSSPLDQLSDRTSLWAKYWEIVEGGKLDEDGGALASEAEQLATAAQQERVAAAELLAQWLAAAGALGQVVQGQVGERSQQVAAFEKLMDVGVEHLAPLVLEKEQPLPSDLPEQLAAGERSGRAVASWLVIGKSGEIFANHAIAQRAQQAAYDYCLWRAQRSLDDFSGGDDAQAVAGAEPAPAPAGKDAPFAAASEALLAFAERSLFPRRRASAQRALLAGRISDADALRGVTLLWPSEDLATGQTSAAVERVPEPVGVAMLPAGEAALRVHGDWKQITLSDTSGASLPGAVQSAGAIQRLGPVAEKDSQWPARFEFVLDPEQAGLTPAISFYYRGHAWSQKQTINRLKPRYRLASTAPGDDATVSVDSLTVKANVMIVLDCSASMRVDSGAEGSRLARGRKAIKSAIDELLFAADDEEEGGKQIKLSLVYFGHRRGEMSWPRGSGKSQIQWNRAFGLDTGEPWDKDFAQVFDSRDFPVKANAQVALARIIKDDPDPDDGKDTGVPSPTGYTPLYAAMEYALKLQSFADATAEAGPRHMLIVSDGDDQIPTLAQLLAESQAPPDMFSLDQFIPPWSQTYNSPPVRAARAANIRSNLQDINLYFFYLANDNKHEKIAADLELDGKKVLVMENDADLKEELLQRIGVRKYSVRGPLQEPKFGSSTASRVFPRSIGWHTIGFEGKEPSTRKFRIGGGEKLAVTIPAPPDPLGLKFEREKVAVVDAKARGKITLPAGVVEEEFRQSLTAYEVQCQAQTGKKGERDFYCNFDLVFHNSQDGQFTLRPPELWVEITPQGGRAGSGPAKYTFCNPFPLEGTRAPVYRLTAPLWPTGTKTAKVAVWVRMFPTSEVEASRINSVSHGQRAAADKSAADGVLFKFNAQPDMNRALVKITEVHPTASGPDENMYFLTSATRQNLKGLTQVFYDGQVEHQFLIDGNADDAQRTTILALPQAQWKKLAAPLDGGPLEVTIP